MDWPKANPLLNAKYHLQVGPKALRGAYGSPHQPKQRYDLIKKAFGV